jgi:hypothetical protein
MDTWFQRIRIQLTRNPNNDIASMRIILPIISLLTLAASSCAWAGEGFLDQYFVRSDSITTDAGNAKEVNSAIQTIDPWPRYSGNRRIRTDAARMTGAIQRYRANQAARQDQQVGGQTGTVSNSALTPVSQSQTQANAPQ